MTTTTDTPGDSDGTTTVTIRFDTEGTLDSYREQREATLKQMQQFFSTPDAVMRHYQAIATADLNGDGKIAGAAEQEQVVRNELQGQNNVAPIIRQEILDACKFANGTPADGNFTALIASEGYAYTHTEKTLAKAVQSGETEKALPTYVQKRIAVDRRIIGQDSHFLLEGGHLSPQEYDKLLDGFTRIAKEFQEREGRALATLMTLEPAVATAAAALPEVGQLVPLPGSVACRAAGYGAEL